MDLITGSSGFIGGRLSIAVRSSGEASRLLSRKQVGGCCGVVLGDILDPASLDRACDGVDRVFHCAGFAHAFSSLAESQDQQQWKVNYEGTKNLVNAAGRAHAKVFVYLSSVKAMADPGKNFADEDFPGEPTTSYGKAKRAAESTVLEAGHRYGMHVVNLRLSMVYGAGGRGNLERMGRLVERGWFPPIPETGNRRSLVHVDDVVSVILRVADDARAAGKTYIVSGGEAPSGRELYQALRLALGRKPSTWSVPFWVLKALAEGGNQSARLLGKRMPFNSEVFDRLFCSAWYSPEKIDRELMWRAKVGLQEGLIEMLQR